MITVIRFNWNFDRFNDYNGVTSHFIAIDSITIKDYSRIIIIVLVFRFTTNRVIFHTRGLFYSYEILKISLVIILVYGRYRCLFSMKLSLTF